MRRLVSLPKDFLITGYPASCKSHSEQTADGIKLTIRRSSPAAQRTAKFQLFHALTCCQAAAKAVLTDVWRLEASRPCIERRAPVVSLQGKTGRQNHGEL